MVVLTAAQAVIRYLSVQSSEQSDGTYQPLVQGVFGIFGHGNVAGIGEALQTENSIPYYRVHNEESAGFAAIAFSKEKCCRSVLAVTTSIGPGATNLVTAAAVATINRIPTLFIPGDIFASRRPDPVLQQLEVDNEPNISVNDVFKPVSKYFDRIYRPEQLLQSLPRVVSYLTTPQSYGAVVLSMPQDVQTEQYNWPDYFFEKRNHRFERLRPSPFALTSAVDIISSCKRPVVVVGGGAIYSGAQVGSFCTKFGIPLATTQGGKGIVPWAHECNMGGVGVTGTYCANVLVEKSDLLIVIGSRLGDFCTASKSLIGRHKRILHINLSNSDGQKLHGHFLFGDSKIVLEELRDLLRKERNEDYCREFGDLKSQWIHKKQHFFGDELQLTDTSILGKVNLFLNRSVNSSVVLCAAGGLPGELHRHWEVGENNTYHAEYGYSTMGYEVAGALGVKMASPDKEVYAFVGDGSWLMMHSEIQTSIAMNKKINIILIDNGGFGCINRLQQGCGMPRFGNIIHERKIDFRANAESYGCHSTISKTLVQLEEQLRANMNENMSCVIVLETDPEQSSEGFAWWDVPIAESSSLEKVKQARAKYEKVLGEIGEL